MIPTNVERNEAIVTLWEQGLTIKEIASQLDIPRSTVGYYVRKFNQYGKAGKALPLPARKNQPQDASLTIQAIFKGIQVSDIINELRQGRAEEVYYRLSVIRLMKELGFFVTPDEAKAFQTALKPPSPSEITFQPKKTLQEVKPTGQLEKIFEDKRSRQ
jgi:transposase